MNTPTTVAVQTIWDCRFSRPGYRLTGVADAEQPEAIWMCVRAGGRRAVTEEECASCAHWEPEDLPRE